MNVTDSKLSRLGMVLSDSPEQIMELAALDRLEARTAIPTGIEQLDAEGFGIRRGELHAMFSPSPLLRKLWCVLIASKALEAGQKVLYLVTDTAYDPRRMIAASMLGFKQKEIGPDRWARLMQEIEDISDGQLDVRFHAEASLSLDALEALLKEVTPDLLLLDDPNGLAFNREGQAECSYDEHLRAVVTNRLSALCNNTRIRFATTLHEPEPGREDEDEAATRASDFAYALRCAAFAEIHVLQRSKAAAEIYRADRKLGPPLSGPIPVNQDSSRAQFVVQTEIC